MENSLWFATQRTTALQLLRQSLQWRDAAADAINRQFLNPHENDSADMLQAFNEQHNALEVVRSEVKKAKAHIFQANLANQEVEKHHNYSVGEMHRAQQEYEQGRKHESMARRQLPYIQQLIAKANEAGQ